MNWQDCETITDIERYVVQAQPGGSIAKAWREMLDDMARWGIEFTVDDFIKVGHWSTDAIRAKQARLQATVEQLAKDGAFDEL